MTTDLVRVHIWVEGRVQGVGFRAFVAQSAAIIGVNGWVRNVGWNTVETMAEGTRTQVERFLQAVKAGPRASRVNECRVEEETGSGEFEEFIIIESR